MDTKCFYISVGRDMNSSDDTVCRLIAAYAPTDAAQYDYYKYQKGIGTQSAIGFFFIAWVYLIGDRVQTIKKPAQVFSIV